MRRLTRYGVLVAAGMLAAGCTAGSSTSSSPGTSTSGKAASSSVLTISNENGALWTCQFSPLNTSDLIKKYPALDLTGVWSVLSSVTASSNTVTMNFSSLAVPYFYYIADQTPIVPEHIWSKMSNPTTNPNSHPVGTGPYLMNKCSPSNITYTANPNYWQPGEPKISKIQYPAYTSNNTANNDLANGNAQWGAQYIPGIKAFYTSKSPNFHYWFPPTVNVS